MPCSCTPYYSGGIHYSTAIAVDDTSTPYLKITATNTNNIASLDYFYFVLRQNPDSVVTTAPIPIKITINGTDVNVLNAYSLPVNSNRINVRKLYKGAYVAPSSGDPYIILWNTPSSPAYAS